MFKAIYAQTHKYKEFRKVEGSKISRKSIVFINTNNNQVDDVMEDKSPLKIIAKHTFLF